MRRTIVLLYLLICSGILFGQSIQRQSIGSMGATYHSNDLSIEQSVGQAYFTATSSNDKQAVLPGFIQPPSYRVEDASTSEADFSITVYPNPTTEVINFNVEGDFGSRVELMISDISGKRVWSATDVNLKNHQVNCMSWQSGTYVIRAMDSAGNMFRAKLIKTRN